MQNKDKVSTVHKHHGMKTQEQTALNLHKFLNLALDGGEWWASCKHQLFNSNKINLSTNWLDDWVGPRGSTDMVVKRKIPVHAGNRTLII